MSSDFNEPSLVFAFSVLGAKRPLHISKGIDDALAKGVMKLNQQLASGRVQRSCFNCPELATLEVSKTTSEKAHLSMLQFSIKSV